MIDQRFRIHSNWKFGLPTPRECRGYRPERRADKWVGWGCVILCGIAIAARWL